jgi:type IV fimbrial biogenesis protein FimT
MGAIRFLLVKPVAPMGRSYNGIGFSPHDVLPETDSRAIVRSLTCLHLARSSNMNRKDAGFTLIELMTAVAIMAVTLTIGLPTFNSTIQRVRVDTALHLLSTDMAMARNSAVMRHSQIVVCPRDPSGGCADGQDWSRGWMVFGDPDGNHQPDDEHDILRVSEPPSGALLFLPASRPLLRYQSDGRAANSNLTVYVCKDARYAGKVVVNNLGRVRTERATTAESICPRA